MELPKLRELVLSVCDQGTTYKKGLLWTLLSHSQDRVSLSDDLQRWPISKKQVKAVTLSSISHLEVQCLYSVYHLQSLVTPSTSMFYVRSNLGWLLNCTHATVSQSSCPCLPLGLSEERKMKNRTLRITWGNSRGTRFWGGSNRHHLAKEDENWGR